MGAGGRGVHTPTHTCQTPLAGPPPGEGLCPGRPHRAPPPPKATRTTPAEGRARQTQGRSCSGRAVQGPGHLNLDGTSRRGWGGGGGGAGAWQKYHRPHIRGSVTKFHVLEGNSSDVGGGGGGTTSRYVLCGGRGLPRAHSIAASSQAKAEAGWLREGGRGGGFWQLLDGRGEGVGGGGGVGGHGPLRPSPLTCAFWPEFCEAT